VLLLYNKQISAYCAEYLIPFERTKNLWIKTESSGAQISKVLVGSVEAEKLIVRGYDGGTNYIIESIDEIRLKQIAEEVMAAGESVFKHIPTSGAIITPAAKPGTFLIGAFKYDLDPILKELSYPEIGINVDFSFPVPNGQKFNLLNIDNAGYNYYTNNGGFFTRVNGPWIDAAVKQQADIMVVSDLKYIYKETGDGLTGFGKEIHRLEWVHGYRYDPNTKMMVPPGKANGLKTITLKEEYFHESVYIHD
jgi:hypothetical protein